MNVVLNRSTAGLRRIILGRTATTESDAGYRADDMLDDGSPLVGQPPRRCGRRPSSMVLRATTGQPTAGEGDSVCEPRAVYRTGSSRAAPAALAMVS
jgi:hypothetical protein